MCCGVALQSLAYAWPITLSVAQPAQDPVTFYNYVINQGVSMNPAATPFIMPARVPMMILRDPPGEPPPLPTHGSCS